MPFSSILILICLIILPYLSYIWIQKSAVKENKLKWVYYNKVVFIILEIFVLISAFSFFDFIVGFIKSPLINTTIETIEKVEILYTIQTVFNYITTILILCYFTFAAVYAVYIKKKNQSN